MDINVTLNPGQRGRIVYALRQQARAQREQAAEALAPALKKAYQESADANDETADMINEAHRAAEQRQAIRPVETER